LTKKFNTCAESSKKGGRNMSRDEFKAIVIKFTEEAWNNGNLSVMDEIFAKDVVSHAPSAPEEIRLVAYKNRLKDFRTDYPDVQITIDEIIAEGNTVADRWTCVATFSGPGKTAPIPGTGKKAIVKGTRVGHFVNGRIVEDWYTYDVMSWAQQAGLMPGPEE
jgi:steroid delta-isomerase-like uncharacterized protein